ncbi:MAG: ATP-binding cassette domain-containing protein [Christensenellales bacterium]
MIATQNISLSYSGKPLFKNVNLKFTPGNCYGIIGANGAGKSTFLKILSGELEPTTGDGHLSQTISACPCSSRITLPMTLITSLDTVIMGNTRLYEIMQEKEALYAKPDFSEQDGILASELEGEFAELNGWTPRTTRVCCRVWGQIMRSAMHRWIP